MYISCLTDHNHSQITMFQIENTTNHNITFLNVTASVLILISCICHIVCTSHFLYEAYCHHWIIPAVLCLLSQIFQENI